MNSCARMADVTTMTVKQMREELTALGGCAEGCIEKSDIVARLLEARCSAESKAAEWPGNEADDHFQETLRRLRDNDPTLTKLDLKGQKRTADRDIDRDRDREGDRNEEEHQMVGRTEKGTRTKGKEESETGRHTGR